MTTIVKCREVINNIKDELRNQVSLWDYQLMHDRAMNLSLQRKAENAIEKSKVLQKVRFKHAEKLLSDLECSHPKGEDIENDIQTYWLTIVPDIKDALESFREINNIRKFQDEICKIEVPEELDVKRVFVSPQDSEPEIKSVMTYVARRSNESTGKSMSGSMSHNRALIKRSKPGNKVHKRK